MDTGRITVLREVEAAVWRELARAAHEPGHGWRVGVLATTDGEWADARSVVLREWDEATRTLMIFTDARSPKVKQIEACPRGMLVHWCARLGWQLRLRVALTVETSGLQVSSRWARMKMTPAAHDYLSPLPPGSPLTVHPEPQRESRGHFAVMNATVLAVDWTELHADGHRRALIDEQGARWVAP